MSKFDKISVIHGIYSVCGDDINRRVSVENSLGYEVSNIVYISDKSGSLCTVVLELIKT